MDLILEILITVISEETNINYAHSYSFTAVLLELKKVLTRLYYELRELRRSDSQHDEPDNYVVGVMYKL